MWEVQPWIKSRKQQERKKDKKNDTTVNFNGKYKLFPRIQSVYLLKKTQPFLQVFWKGKLDMTRKNEVF